MGGGGGVRLGHNDPRLIQCIITFYIGIRFELKFCDFQQNLFGFRKLKIKILKF